jgi:hypothetical protein
MIPFPIPKPDISSSPQIGMASSSTTENQLSIGHGRDIVANPENVFSSESRMLFVQNSFEDTGSHPQYHEQNCADTNQSKYIKQWILSRPGGS